MKHPKARLLVPLIATLAISIIGCGNDNDYSDCVKQYRVKPVFSEMQDQFTDKELLSAAYTSHQMPPSYQPSQSRPYTAVYLCNWDTTSWENRDGPQVPLTAPDSTGASEFLQLVLDRDTTEDRVVSTFEVNEVHFEFLVTGTIDTDNSQIYRVANSAVIEVGDVSNLVDYWPFKLDPDRLDTVVTAPLRFRSVPATTLQIEAIMEDYFWLRLAPLAAILSSFTTDLGTEFLHRYYTLQFVGGDWNMNDYATLYQIDLRIGKMTGTVTAEKHEIRSVTGCYHPNSIM